MKDEITLKRSHMNEMALKRTYSSKNAEVVVEYNVESEKTFF